MFVIDIILRWIFFFATQIHMHTFTVRTWIKFDENLFVCIDKNADTMHFSNNNKRKHPDIPNQLNQRKIWKSIILLVFLRYLYAYVSVTHTQSLFLGFSVSVFFLFLFQYNNIKYKWTSQYTHVCMRFYWVLLRSFFFLHKYICIQTASQSERYIVFWLWV